MNNDFTIYLILCVFYNYNKNHNCVFYELHTQCVIHTHTLANYLLTCYFSEKKLDLIICMLEQSFYMRVGMLYLNA